MIRLYDVVRLARDPEHAGVTDVFADFELQRAADEAPASWVDDPSFTLYSLDLANDTVVFVQTPGEELSSLATAPFAYVAQRRAARRVLKIDVATFLERFAPTARDVPRVLHLYSVGRCGSTLLHHALNCCAGVTSVSEPDIFFQLALWRQSGRLDATRVGDLAGAALRCIWRQRPVGCDVLALKHRGKGIWAWREFRDALPSACSLFLYRDPIPTVQSFDRMSGYLHGRTQWRLEVPLVASLARAWLGVGARRAGVDVYREYLRQETPLGVVTRCGYAGHHLLDWLSKVACWRALQALEAEAAAVRYEDMIAAPATTLRALCEHYALGAADDARVTSVFAHDAQSGAPYAGAGRSGRRYPLSAHTVDALEYVLRREGFTTGALLPGTLTLAPQP